MARPNAMEGDNAGINHLEAMLGGQATTPSAPIPVPATEQHTEGKKDVINPILLGMGPKTAADTILADTNVTTPSTTIRFSNKGIESHGLVALSKYFGAKMTSLDAYIPLLVFNPQWLRQDLLQQSIRKRSVKEKLEDSYIGLMVPLEWKMTFGE